MMIGFGLSNLRAGLVACCPVGVRQLRMKLREFLMKFVARMLGRFTGDPRTGSTPKKVRPDAPERACSLRHTDAAQRI